MGMPVLRGNWASAKGKNTASFQQDPLSGTRCPPVGLKLWKVWLDVAALLQMGIRVSLPVAGQMLQHQKLSANDWIV